MRTTPEARRKVLRIVAADRMNVAAQNAFLKLLEEPPASVVWILEAEDPGGCSRRSCRAAGASTSHPGAPGRRGLARTQLGGGAGGSAEDVARIESVSGGAQLRRLAARAASRPRGVGPREARRARHGAAAAHEHLEVLATLGRGGPGSVVPTAKRLSASRRSGARRSPIGMPSSSSSSRRPMASRVRAAGHRV
jgi:DNA polymerase III subunit delta'